MKQFLRFGVFMLWAFAAMPVFSQLQALGDTTICEGGQAQLSATGGGASYYWTSEPFDPSLLIPQQQNPMVSPQVTTMYVVQSNIATGNLILNGSFELGVMGFSSDYVNNQTSIVAEGTYAVVTDAHTVHPNFYCNHDHTSGSGKFMAVNGSGVPNVRVWYLDLPQIQPHHQYEFSTWITSLHATNPALLQFSINGELMAEPFQAYSSTCDWYQFFYIWESDTNTHANISIVNQNTILSGNDFALDDISFATVLVYYDTVWVTVLPQYDSPFTAPSDACAQEVIQVSYTGTAPDTADYHWDFDGAEVLSGSGQGPFEIRFISMGSYTVSLFVTADGCPSDTTEHGITIGESPSVELSADATFIPYGTSTTLHGSYTGGQGPFDFYWDPASLLLNPESLDPQTDNLLSSTDFFLYVTDQSAQCTGFALITIEVTGGPLGVNATADPANVCPGEPVQLNAVTTGGTGSYTYLWTSSPAGFTSTLPSPSVVPLQSTDYFVEVDDGLSIEEDMTSVIVHPQPSANAGDTLEIPYGTSTTLFGNATGGSGSYSYQWNPAEWLTQANVRNPQTKNLTDPVLFDLTVTDLISGCASEKDFVLVTLLGGPLGVVILTETPEICRYESSRLTALSTGGNQGNYAYTWTDDDWNSLGYNDTLRVTPTGNTIYHVIVYDGFNLDTATFTQIVFQPADFTLAGGQETVFACPYDTIVLVPSPHPEDWNYLWSNGSTNDTIRVGSTGIGFDMKTYSLTAETPDGCRNDQQVTVIFDFGNCFGMAELTASAIRFYPNPGRGIFTIESLMSHICDKIAIYSSQGELVYSLPGPFLLDPWERKVVDLSFLPAGIYFLSLSGEQGPLICRMMILPH